MSKRSVSVGLLAIAVAVVAVVPLWLSDAPRWLTGLALLGVGVAFVIEIVAHGFAFRDKDQS